MRFNRPEVLNAFDFQTLREARTGGRGRILGRRHSRRGPHRNRPRLLRRRRPEGVERGVRRSAERVLEVVPGPSRTPARPAAGDRQAVARINGICVGGGNELQMACDLAVMVEDAFIRHVGRRGSVPAGGATQWLTIMVGDRRAPGSSFCARRSRRGRRRSGASSIAPSRPRKYSTPRSTASSRASRASSRRPTRYASST